MIGGGFPNGLGVDLQVKIREKTITGNIIGTSEITSVPDEFDGVVAFNFPSFIPLTPSNLYVIDITYIKGDNFGIGGGFNDYPSGCAIVLGQTVSTEDIWFAEGFANSVPLTKDYCMNGLWQYMKRVDGTTFKNQGVCIGYIKSGK